MQFSLCFCKLILYPLFISPEKVPFLEMTVDLRLRRLIVVNLPRLLEPVLRLVLERGIN